MTALSDSVFNPYQAPTQPRRLQVGTDVIYKGALVMSATGTSTIIAGADTANATFRGVALEEVDNSAGASDKYCDVAISGIFEFAIAVAAAGDEGTKVYLVDDATVGLAATTANDVPCGVIVEVVDATTVKVDISYAWAL